MNDNEKPAAYDNEAHQKLCCEAFDWLQEKFGHDYGITLSVYHKGAEEIVLLSQLADMPELVRYLLDEAEYVARKIQAARFRGTAALN